MGVQGKKLRSLTNEQDVAQYKVAELNATLKKESESAKAARKELQTIQTELGREKEKASDPAKRAHDEKQSLAAELDAARRQARSLLAELEDEQFEVISLDNELKEKKKEITDKVARLEEEKEKALVRSVTGREPSDEDIARMKPMLKHMQLPLQRATQDLGNSDPRAFSFFYIFRGPTFDGGHTVKVLEDTPEEEDFVWDHFCVR
ncbi:hypothetical protein HD806DRAFT_526806 [Xylariaceae sp. AK1471]|nr:hypothetical protein HD806DRAFT_526806 [Xylariaceae sp. AK1471]